MVLRINIQGVPKVMAYLQLKKMGIDGEIKKSMTKVGMHMQNEVKESISGHKAEPTSVDTGKFLGSVDFQTVKKGVIIFTPVPYAKFLEYGTIRIQPRRHFNNSKDRNKGKIKQIIKDHIDNI